MQRANKNITTNEQSASETRGRRLLPRASCRATLRHCHGCRAGRHLRRPSAIVLVASSNAKRGLWKNAAKDARHTNRPSHTVLFA
jgi:hypothetical protein